MDCEVEGVTAGGRPKKTRSEMAEKTVTSDGFKRTRCYWP